MRKRSRLGHAMGAFEVNQPTKLTLVGPWKIRYVLHTAEKFVRRSLTELEARGEMGDLSQEEVAEALREREDIQSEGYTADLLVGASTISELPSPLYGFIARRSYNRWITLALMAGITSGDLPKKLRALSPGSSL